MSPANSFDCLSPVPLSAADIFQLKETGAKTIEIDYLDEETIVEAAEAYGDRSLDILINVGGRWWHVRSVCSA